MCSEGLVAEIDRCQADAAHRHAVSFLQFGEESGAGDSEPALFALLLDRNNLADFFDDASEHDV